MRKVIFPLAFALSFAAFVACNKKSDGPDCTALTNNVSTAGQTFGTDPSTANCNAYRAALQAYLDSSCGSDSDDASLQAVLDLLTC